VTHPLLGRLLRKVGANADEAPSLEAWRELLALVGRTYQEADQDRYTLERSIDISSREMQGLYQDLKRRSESELALERHRVVESLAIMHATLESSVDGVMVVDRERSVIAANRRIHEILGVPDDITNSSHARFVAIAVRGLADPEAEKLRIEEIYASDGIVRDELHFLDGRTVERYSAPVKLADGQLAGRVTFLRDVTADRLAHRQLDAAREAAEAASRTKSMFLANMSHELRTPLNAVIGLAELLLLDKEMSARQREYLDGIGQSGRHLLALVNDVLDLSKIEAGKHDLELEPVHACDAVDEAIAALLPLAQHRGVALSAEGGVDVRLRADPVRLRQILYNLISNAVKFTDRDGQVRVSTEVDDGVVSIAVVDTGIGIAEKDMTRLYREFEQLNLPSGDRPGGTGLGLALTKRLVDMHGGTIDVVSRVGLGTTFTVRIPTWPAS
jgi:signal transduction histidine kinase